MQERYRSDPWALLVGCILFNMVHGKKAQPVHEEFLRRWSNPIALFKHNVEKDLVELLKPLGFQNKRAERVLTMSSQFLEAVFKEGAEENDLDVEKLYGIGKYGVDSYNIFCRGILIEDVGDKELRKYVEWAHGAAADGLVPADAGAAPETGREHEEAVVPEL